MSFFFPSVKAMKYIISFNLLFSLLLSGLACSCEKEISKTGRKKKRVKPKYTYKDHREGASRPISRNILFVYHAFIVFFYTRKLRNKERLRNWTQSSQENI